MQSNENNAGQQSSPAVVAHEANGHAAATTTISTDVAEFYRLLHPAGTVAEIRAPKCPDKPGGTFKTTASGYIDNPEAAAKLAKAIDSKRPVGIYLTINPVAPALLARSANCIDWRANSTTTDDDIVRRRNLLVDVDPARPAGVSATDSEMQEAVGLARRMANELAAEGWPAPLVGMSGNGAYLIFRINLANDAEATDLCQRVLTGLAERFDTEAAKVDTGTYNASRIVKILGTVSRKGTDFAGSENNPARPHRQSWFEPPADELAVVPRELLESVASDPKPAMAIVGPAPSANGKHKAAGKSGLNRCRAFHAKMPDAISGQRGHDATLAAACECYRFGLSDDEARATMAEFNANRTGGEPWSERDLSHKLADARAKVEAAGEFGSRLPDRRHKRNGSAQGQPAQSSGELLGNVPTIDANEKDLAIITPRVWEAIERGNNPPTMFQHGGLPSRIESNERGEPVVKMLDHKRMRHEAARRAKFKITKKVGDSYEDKNVAPPKDIIDDLLATAEMPLPTLNRMVESPVFAPDGSLQTTPGYHPAAGVYYRSAPGFSVPAVSPCPSADEVGAAVRLICEEMLGDFPFVGDSELAHAVALALLPFARDLIDGPTPLHLFEKPSPGTGATLLVEILAWLSIGRALAAMTEGRDEDEWRKRITAILFSGPVFNLLDNLRRRLDSAAYSSVLTATHWEDRILGITQIIVLPVRCVWIATGNNPALSNEIARRTVRIRMDAKRDRPWLRGEDEFRHPDLRGWVKENRGQLVWAALTIIQAWIAAGRPPGKTTLGMFESWSSTMGGILDVAGIPGFLANLESFYDESDAESLTWRGLLLAWREQFGEGEVLAKELFPLAVECGIALGTGEEHSQRVTFGKQLTERRDRIFDIQTDDGAIRLRIARGKTFRRATLWKCECVSEVSLLPPLHTHAGAHTRDAVGNTITDSPTHTDESVGDEYDPWS